MIRAVTSRTMGVKRTTVFFAVGLAVMLGVLLLGVTKPAHAKTFTVNYIGDGPDAVPGNGSCNVVFGLCSLRAAIEEANANDNTPTVDIINFDIPNDPNIPGNELKTIKPTKELPKITETLTINGYSQPGASPNTKAVGSDADFEIELDGTRAGSSRGVVIHADNSVVKGLVINRFDQEGVNISFLATGVKVQGNYIGTGENGNFDLGNHHGVEVTNGSNHLIGGTTPAARNLISGNDLYGVYLQSSSSGVKVQGNYIGTGYGGFGDLGNDIYGVFVTGSDNFIGGNTSEAANTIAYSGHHGVLVIDADATENRILRNSIHSNGGLGIDLGGNGVTPNDPKDPDTGPNGRQNYPWLTSATTFSGETTIKGQLNSKPNKTFTLQFFSNPPATDEGKKFIGQKNVTTDSNGNVLAFAFQPAQAVAAGQEVTATATDPDGNTSEFSGALTVVVP
jgi:CSLREA domain-containing protein